MPSEKVLNQKKAKVSELAEKFKKAKMIVLTDYRGIPVDDDTKLRTTIRNDGNEYEVVKNSTIADALKEAGVEGFDGTLEGPTAVVIGYEDYVTPAKAVNDYAKNNDFYNINIETGEDIFNPVFVGKKADIRIVDNGYILVSHESDDSVMFLDTNGNIKNKFDISFTNNNHPNNYLENRYRR